MEIAFSSIFLIYNFLLGAYSSLNLYGTLDDINRALSRIVVTPCVHYHGRTHLSIFADDLGNTGIPSVLGGGATGPIDSDSALNGLHNAAADKAFGGSATFSGTTDFITIPFEVLPLNDRPTIDIPIGTITTSEEGAVVIPNVVVRDPDSMVITSPVLHGSTLNHRYVTECKLCPIFF